jgi:hypothetical protein
LKAEGRVPEGCHNKKRPRLEWGNVVFPRAHASEFTNECHKILARNQKDGSPMVNTIPEIVGRRGKIVCHPNSDKKNCLKPEKIDAS